MKKSLRSVFLVLVLSGMSACTVGLPPGVDFGKVPTNYRQTIPARMATILPHPEGARYQFGDGDPAPTWAMRGVVLYGVPHWAGYQVLFYVNAKDARGVSTGDQEWFADIRNDVIVGIGPYTPPYDPGNP